MFDILAITAPIYLLILIGFLMTRFGLFAKADMRVFGKFVITLALPALVFRAVAQRPLAEVVNVGYLLAYGGGAWLVIGLGYLWSRRVARLQPLSSTFYAMGMSCSNSGFVGYPILLLTLAPLAGVVLALNMIVENLLVIPFLLFLAERARSGAGHWRDLARLLGRLAYNPLILGLLAGLLVSALGWSVPVPLMRTIDMLAVACSALSLFVIGGALFGLPMGGLGRQILPIVVGKLVFHPLCVLLAMVALPMLGLPAIAPSLKVAAVLSAAMPMMGIYPTLAQAYGQEDVSAVALLVTTMASFFSLNALLWLAGHCHWLA